MIVLPLMILGLYQLHHACGCTCVSDSIHVQEYFCDAEFVVRAVVLNKQFIGKTPANREIKYTVQVDQLYKGRIPVFQGRKTTMYSEEGPSLCGITLTVGDDMLLTGTITSDRQIRLTSCNSWISKWSSLTTLEQLGLRYGLYNRACVQGCKVLRADSSGKHICDGGFPVCCRIEDSPCLGSVCLRTNQGRCDWSKCLQ